jgi:hypothetical protein
MSKTTGASSAARSWTGNNAAERSGSVPGSAARNITGLRNKMRRKLSGYEKADAGG